MSPSRPSSVPRIPLLLLSASCAFAAPEPAARDPWRDLATGNTVEAHAVFIARDSELSPRERGYGEAVALLNLQPRTDARIQRASGLLDAIIADPEDKLTVPARFLRARIDHIHRMPPNIPEALRGYDELFAAHAEHPLAQLGATLAAMARIFQAESDPLGEPLAAAEAILPRLTDRTVKAGMHVMLANACIRLGERDQRRALGHFEAAQALGIRSPKLRASVLASIGGLSEEFGQPERALAAYETFLAEFERDDRAHAIRERLAALKEGAR